MLAGESPSPEEASSLPRAPPAQPQGLRDHSVLERTIKVAGDRLTPDQALTATTTWLCGTGGNDRV